VGVSGNNRPRPPGGTALSKLYFPQSWRFSEDLNFGVEGEHQESKQEFEVVLDTITDRSGIEFDGGTIPRAVVDDSSYFSIVGRDESVDG